MGLCVCVCACVVVCVCMCVCVEFSPIIIITATELLSTVIVGSHTYSVLFRDNGAFTSVNTLVTTSPSRLLLTLLPDIAAPVFTLNHTVSSAILPVLLSKIVQYSIASVPSQNVSLAGC